MNDKWQTIFNIEAISRDIMQLSIRTEITGVTDADLKTIEAGAKRILRLIKEAREKNSKETKE